MAKKNGLGKGLGEIFLDNSTDNTGVITLKISEIEPNKEQARKDFNEDAIGELADSIAEHGVIQPLIVRDMMNGSYQLIAGERRWRAARIAGLTEVPVIIKSLNDEDATVISLIENLQRENLNPIEEGLGYADLMDKFGFTQEEAAKKVGKPRTTVANALRIIKLPEKVQSMIENGTLSTGHAKTLAGLDNDEDILTIAELIAEKGLSVRETEKLVKSYGKAKTPVKQRTVKRESFFDEVELALTNSLGRKARVITSGKKENGTLEIAFHSKADLEAIANALSALE